MLSYSGFDSSKEDFFNAFDKKKEDQQQFRANDGFDHDTFGSGWGGTNQENTENLQKLTLNKFEGGAENAKNDGPTHRSRPRRKSNGFEAFETEGSRPGEGSRPRRKSSIGSFSSLESFGNDAENAIYDGAPHPKPRRKSNAYEGNGERTANEAPQRSRQRRKSYGGGAGAESDKKERRRKESGKNEDGDRRRRSVSRSRRKPRRGSTTKPGSDDKGSASGDGAMSKASSIRNMFNRKQGNDDA